MPALDVLKADISISAALRAQRDVTGLKPITNNSTVSHDTSFTTGAAVAQGADQVYCALRTIAASSSENVDLSGTLTNLVNEASAAFARIKCVMVKLLSKKDDSTNGTACSSITVGGAASNAWTGFFADSSDKITIPGGSTTVKGGCFAICREDATGWTVTAGTGDILKVANDDATYTAAYYLVVVGSAS